MGVTITKDTLDRCKNINEFWKDQMPMNVAEECGELLVAISKMERIRRSYVADDMYTFFEPIDWASLDQRHIRIFEDKKLDVETEMADVFISILAIANRYGIDMKDVLQKVEQKIRTERG